MRVPEGAETEADEEAWDGVTLPLSIQPHGGARGNTAEADSTAKWNTRTCSPGRLAVEYLKLEVLKNVLGIPVALVGFGCGSFQRRMIGGGFPAL